MNQLETNLLLWAICSILLFELLIVICVCRCCFNRIKPKRFYVKREEYESMQGSDGTQPYFQSTILRPPHADELALIGTIRNQNTAIIFDDGIDNFGFYRDKKNEEEQGIGSAMILPSPSSTVHSDWVELRSPGKGQIINTEHLIPAEYEVRSYPTNNFTTSLQGLPTRPNVIDFHSYAAEYDNENYKNMTYAYDDDELDNFRSDSLHRSNANVSHSQRKDTSTESYTGNYSMLIPKSILKSGTSTTSLVHGASISYSSKYRDSTPSKFDQSPDTSAKLNTDESIPFDSSINTIEKIIIPEPIFTNRNSLSPSSSSISSSNPMRFANVSRLKEVEWEVPSEFQTVVYDLTNDNETFRSAVIYRSNENLNLNNNNNDYHRQPLNRIRTQSAVGEQGTNVSRVFVPWKVEDKALQSSHRSKDIGAFNNTQQQAFEY